MADEKKDKEKKSSSKETSIQKSEGGKGEIGDASSEESYDATVEWLNQQRDNLTIDHETWLKARRDLSKMVPWDIMSPAQTYLKELDKALQPLLKKERAKPASPGPEREFKNPTKITTNEKGEEVATVDLKTMLVDNFITAGDRMIRYGSYFGSKGLASVNVVSALLGINAFARTIGSTAKKVFIDWLGYDPKVADQLAAMSEFGTYLMVPATGIAGISGKVAQAAQASRDIQAKIFAEEFIKRATQAGLDTGGAYLPPGIIEELPGFTDPIAQAFRKFVEYFKATQDKVNRLRSPVSREEQAARMARGEILEEIVTPEIIAGMRKEFQSLGTSLSNEFNRLMEKGVTEDDFIEFIAKFYPVADAMPEVFGRAASAGRALVEFRSPTKQMTDEFNRMFDFFSAMTGIVINPGNWREARHGMMNALRPMLETPKTTNGFLSQWGASGVMDHLGTIFKLNLISGPFTAMANIIGGSTVAGLNIAKGPISAAYGKYLLGDDRRRLGMETGARIIGYTQGILDGFKHLNTAKLEGAFENLPGYLKPLKMAGGMLIVGDSIIRASITRGELLARGIIDAAGKGKKGMAMIRHAENYASSPPVSALSDAIEMGNEAAATLPLGKIGQRIAMLRETADDVAVLPIGTWMATFIKAVSSMAKTVYNNSPVLSILSTKTLNEMASGDPIRIADAGGRIIASHMLSTLAFGLAASGAVTGDGPIDPEMRKQWLATGWKPRQLRIGNTEFDASRLAPLGDFLVMHANLYEAWKTGDLSPEVAERQMKALFWVGFQTLSGFNPYGMLGDVGEIFGGNTTPEKFNSLAGRIAGNYVPFSGALRQVNQYYNPEMRNAIDEYRGLEESMFSQIGGWRGRFRRDIFGDKMYYNRLWHDAPVEDPDRELIKNLRVNGLNPPDNYLYGRSLPRTEFADINPDTSAAFPLTQEEADFFAVKKGEWFRHLMKTFREDEGWRALPDALKRQTIESAYKVTAERAAVGELFQQYPQLQGPVAAYFQTKGMLLSGEIQDKDFKKAMQLRLDIERADAADGADYQPSTGASTPSQGEPAQ